MAKQRDAAATDQLVLVIHDFFNQTWLSTCYLFLYLKKKKEEMACPVVSCHFILKHCEPRGLFIYHPPKISTHFNSQIQSQPKTVYGNVDVVDVFDLHQWEKVFFQLFHQLMLTLVNSFTAS